MKNLFELKNWDVLTVDQAIDSDMKIFKGIKSFNLAGLHEDGVNSVIERLNLEVFHDCFKAFNTSNNLPYHNSYHSQCMVLNCYEGAYHEKLPLDDTRALVAAALLHDANHSGGKESDEQNIEHAVEFVQICQRYASALHIGLSEYELSECIDCVKITKYPYENVPASPAQRIIRDADLMQPYEQDQQILLTQYLGLKRELEANGKSYSKIEFAEGMYEFLNSIAWYTIWATDKAKDRGWDVLKLNLKYILESHES